MGRDKTYAREFTPDIMTNGLETVRRANLLLAAYEHATGDARTRRVNSGWRPPSLNAGVAGAAKKSNHMLGLAVDIADASETLDKWLMTPAGQTALADIGLWHEHPSATKGWAHVQTVPPKSGNRTFYP
jgi:hypothetical protein